MPIPTPASQDGEWMNNGDLVRICGWGNTQMVGTIMPGELHCVNVAIVENDICNGSESYAGAILRGMFCAGNITVYQTKLLIFC